MSKVCEKENCHATHGKIAFVWWHHPIRRNSLASCERIFFRLRRLSVPILQTTDNSDFYGEVGKSVAVRSTPEVHRGTLSDIFQKIRPRFRHLRPRPTVFSPSLPADIMLTSLRPSIFRVARRSRWSTSSIRSLSLSFSRARTRFLLRRRLLTPARPEAAPPGTNALGLSKC